MPRRADLTLIEGDTETIREVVTDDDTGLPLNLTGMVVEFIIKTNDVIPDSDPTAVVLSTATGEITVTDAPAGVCEIAIPAQTPGTRWRRLLIIDDTDRKTAIYGPLYVISV